MDRRLISAVAPVGASFGLIALGTCTAMAADAIKPNRYMTTHARCFVVSEPAATGRGRYRVAMRHVVGEEHSPPRMALVLGIAF
jgi:hypothetical protein